MTVNRKIIDALAFLKIPVAESFYDGKEEEYITFETPIDSGADFGDDEPGKIIVQVRVHWWIPIKKNYLAEKKEDPECSSRCWLHLSLCENPARPGYLDPACSV